MAWFPKKWKKCVISIEIKETFIDDDEETEEFKPIATAFLIDFKGHNLIVTCKHVVEGIEHDPENIFLCFNKKDDKILRIPLEELKKEKYWGWFIDDDVEEDIAINLFPINSERDDVFKLGSSLFEKFEDLNEGDDVFFLGFPLGIKKTNKIDPILRGGSSLSRMMIRRIY